MWSALADVLLVLTFAMIRKAANRPVGEPRKPPGWLAAADSSSLPQIAGASLLLAVVNPINLSMLLGAGVTLAGHSLSVSHDVVVSALFACIGALGVLTPTVIALVPSLRRRASLDHWRRWLIEHNEPLTIGTTLIFAMLFVGKGLRGIL